MRRSILAAALAATVFATPARADIVCEWIGYGAQIAQASTPPVQSFNRAPGPESARAETQLALAMFEALNAIDRRYESYLGMPKGDPKASQEAAAVSAAHAVLSHHYPAQKAGLDDSYAIALAAVTDAGARAKGVAIGEAAAKLALAAGGLDPAIALVEYRPRTTPGVYIATALPVFEPWSRAIKPWAIPSVEAIMPPPPPTLTSEVWARDYDEVKRLGGRTGSERDAQRSLMARYRITPDLMPTLRLVADAPKRSPVQNARMFMLVGMAADDSYMVTGAAKLHYNFWRPVTAIRNGEDDGHPATAPDPAWVSLINTPNHPEYPCGHCTFAGAAAEVMKAETGAAPPGGVRVASRSIPNAAVQVLPSWDKWVEEVSYSRILGGVHYRFSNDAGEEIGRKAAKAVLAKVARPIK